MYRLYYYPITAAMAPHSVLEETDAEFELVELDVFGDVSNSYEAKHPLKRVPVLEDGKLTLFESAAIMMHLCDKHQEMNLAPPPGDPLRPLFYQWLVFLPAHVHAATKVFYYPHRFTTDEACIPSVRKKGIAVIDEIFQTLDQTIGDEPWLLGDRFSACDHALHMYCTWIEVETDGVKQLSAYPNLARFVDRIRERPAIQRMLKAHGIA
ncbi:MAG: glutathione S-transferase family protein [Gammaproteobacteria bacterium]|nr:glutathione S-transferase family protein [Gammaproteobacteria bacterium]